jgi:chemotaxis signal transduction protein
MSEYLCFRCGPHRLLLDIRHVIELGDAPAAATDAQVGRRLWRERSLPLVNLCAFLGAPRPVRAQQVVLGDAQGGQGIIDVDAVEGLRELAPHDFTGLAAVSLALETLIDGVAFDAASGDCLLRLRHPFAWNAALAAEEVAS